jgi:hypothetical protein
MFSRSWTRTWVLAVLFLSALIVGCGGSKGSAKVKGKVKFFDKYLTAGTVAFFAKDGRVGSAPIDFDGNYEMGNAPIGEVTITVKVPVPSLGPAGGKILPAAPKGLPPMRPPGSVADDTKFTPTVDSSKIVKIPGKYSSADTSGLTYTVTPGDQTKDITLSP